MPACGIDVPEFHNIDNTAECIKQIDQQDVGEKAEEGDRETRRIHAAEGLKLEIDKGLEVCSDELVDDKHNGDSAKNHQPQGHGGEPETVAAFETVGEPMYNHAKEEDDENRCIVGEDGGDLLPIPCAADTFDHLGGGTPGGFVGFGRVEVGATTEEETREADEDKGEESIPDKDEALFETRGVVAFAPQKGYYVEQNDGRSNNHEGEVEHAEDRIGEEMVEALGCQIYQRDGHDAVEGAFAFPPLIDKDSQTVEGTPRDEVEGCAMPHTTEQHGIKVIQIGRQLATVAGSQSIDQKKDDGHGYGGNGYPKGLGHEDDNRQHYGGNDVGAGGRIAVAAQGDVEVILKPVAEGDVPTFPETGGIGGLVGRIEVEGEIEPHEHGDTNGDVGIAGEVGIDLKGIDEEGREILERGVEEGIFKNAVDKRDCQPIGQDEFFAEAVEYPEYGNAELATGEEEWFVELGDELVGTNNGTRHELGEESGVEGKVENIVGGAYLAFIDIDYIANVLEGEKADAYRQNDGVGDGIVGGGDGVENVGEEIGILEIAEHSQIDNDAYSHQSGATFLGRDTLGELPTLQSLHPPAKKESSKGCEEQQANVEAGSFVIEKEANEGKVAIAPKPLCLAYGVAPAFLAAQGDHQAKARIDNEEESPEMELGEKQWMLRIEGE